jgi:hypothetical protein
MIAMRDETGDIRIDWMDVLFKQERLPFELGWSLRALNLDEALTLGAKIKWYASWS